MYIIAEAGVNHNGSLELARQLVGLAAACGADAVKFQTFCADSIVTRSAPKAAYQSLADETAESQFAMLQRLELSESDHQALIRDCRAAGIEFLSTPFDLPSLDLLVRRLDIARLKLSSGDITNAPLLLQAALAGKPVILSTGMSTLGEVEDALGVLALGYTQAAAAPDRDAFRRAYRSTAGQAALQNHVTLLHCTSEYPAPFEETNLRAMDTLREAFGLPVGFSDHTPGINVAIAAAARGAAVIEKHFTLDKSLPGPDHKASLDPGELKALVQGLRQVGLALGNGRKMPTPAEERNMAVVRKSLVAARPVVAGEPFTPENLTCKRPGNGVSPMDYWKWLGSRAARDYDRDESVE